MMRHVDLDIAPGLALAKDAVQLLDAIQLGHHPRLAELARQLAGKFAEQSVGEHDDAKHPDVGAGLVDAPRQIARIGVRRLDTGVEPLAARIIKAHGLFDRRQQNIAGDGFRRALACMDGCDKKQTLVIIGDLESGDLVRRPSEAASPPWARKIGFSNTVWSARSSSMRRVNCDSE